MRMLDRRSALKTALIAASAGTAALVPRCPLGPHLALCRASRSDDLASPGVRRRVLPVGNDMRQ